MAAASTIFWMMNFLMALSLGIQVQRIGCMRLWPFWAPLFRLFLVILEVQRQEPFDIYWHSLNQILMKPFWPLANFGMLQRARVCVCVCVCVCVSRSVMSDSLRPSGLWPVKLLCPRDFPCMNTRVHSYSLPKPTQGLNPGLLHCRQVLYCLSHQGSPFCI